MFSPQENEPQEPEEMQANTDSREQQQDYETPAAGFLGVWYI